MNALSASIIAVSCT